MIWSTATASTRSTTASQRQAILCATVGAATGAAWYSSRVLLEEAGGEHEATNNNANNSNPIEINLMDKIANKVYLNPARAAARNQRRLMASSSSFQANSSSSSVTAMALDQELPQRRPLGVPSRLRILAIDLPEVRTQAFSKGTCRVAFDRIFPNGVAPPTYVLDSTDCTDDAGADSSSKNPKKKESTKAKAKTNSSKNKRVQMVEQKAFVQSMLRCFQEGSQTKKDATDYSKVGVEVMEASFADLNPRNLRKTRQVGSYHYDPGKYVSDTHQTTNDTEKNGQDTLTTTGRGQGANQKESHNTNHDEVDHIQHDDESDAPWNQYAWMEELKMRIHGFVPFGDSLEPSSRWNRYATGNIYKQTVPSQRAAWEMLLPPFLQSDPEGVEGGAKKSLLWSSSSNSNNNNWASNKPHAVIANGAAIQRVPSALRLLQKTCREANVPLFVLHDPRAWGGNTHSSLHQALLDLRFLVKQNIILQAMEQQAGFSRGRFVGRLEEQLRHVTEQARSDRQRRQDAIRKGRWNKLDAASLEKRLMEHGVIRREDSLEGGTIFRRYTPAMIQVARQCVADEEERAQIKLENDDNEANLTVNGDNQSQEGSAGNDAVAANV